MSRPSTNPYRLNRRELMKLSTAGVVSYSMSGWLQSLADDAASQPKRRKSCILLWMNGGPSQMDTFDLKPNHAENGGTFKEIETSVPGIKISEHLPKLARNMQDMVLVRSMNTKEGDHGRGTYLMRTGQLPQGPIQYPPIGSLISKELGTDLSELPNSVAIAPYRFFNPAAFGSGFLGPKYAPLIVGDIGNQFFNQRNNDNAYENALKVQDLMPPKTITTEQADARFELLKGLEKDFIAKHPGVSPHSHQTAYERAVRLMRTAAARAFDLDEEKAPVRDAYGRNLFGQGCLLARRLVERGVPFVEVTLSYVPGVQNGFLGWDTHADNFNQVKKLSEVLDPAWGTLMEDLRSRGLLDSTLIVWMGEFGRTPKIQGGRNGGGRDHWPNTFSSVLAGAGIKGGQVIGETSADGSEIKDRPVSVNDLLATVCMALDIDYAKHNMSNVGRPIRIVEKNAKPIKEIVS